MFLDSITETWKNYARNNAFCINNNYYTYADFMLIISSVQHFLDNIDPKSSFIGVETFDDIETYATIYALWFSGLTFVPLNPRFPPERNKQIIYETNISCILSSRAGTLKDSNLPGVEKFNTKQLPEYSTLPALSKLAPENILYVLFTSGSTGKPKGVPISYTNLDAFVNGFYGIGYQLNHTDRFLQMFDFTFDVSVQCYVLPLVIGACVYTVPQVKLKFLSVVQILEKYEITCAKMVPSIISLLKPYFLKIHLPSLKYCLFSGEPLYHGILTEWKNCVPNAVIQNFYGPTEATIDCLYYEWHPQSVEKAHNGIVSIGRCFGDSQTIILNEKGEEARTNEKGELCISGNQLTKGYLNMPEKNKEAFFRVDNQFFYRSGDIVFRDKDGDVMFCGRKDTQVQVQGFRVELPEIEHAATKLANKARTAAIARQDAQNNVVIVLFIESDETEMNVLENGLKSMLPYYMLPGKIIVLPEFPMTTSGKIDRKKLEKHIS